jgi:hypothetical protein
MVRNGVPFSRYADGLNVKLEGFRSGRELPPSANGCPLSGTAGAGVDKTFSGSGGGDAPSVNVNWLDSNRSFGGGNGASERKLFPSRDTFVDADGKGSSGFVRGTEGYL